MIRVTELVKTFKDGEALTEVLKGITFSLSKGGFVAIMGRSGAGKSTFLYQMSLLDDPTSGRVVINDIDTHTMTPEEKTDFRLRECGYVFQDYALLPELSACDNVALPLLMQGISYDEAYSRARETLTKLGLEHRLENLPTHLSGGEQQRVSVARAVVNKPKILFADEPTANLDNDSAWTILNIFKELHAEGQTIIMVTHEEQFARTAERIITLDDGVIVKETM